MLTFKIAAEAGEFAQIHRLNYETFVEEIPQHTPNSARMLVDRFHAENTYIIGMENERLVGMVAVRGARPFSLDAKVSGLDAYLPQGYNVCEIRLLAVAKTFRQRRALPGLLTLLAARCREQHYTLAVVSATTRQSPLYAHLGFTPFGPLVGSAAAWFQPMYVTVEIFQRSVSKTRSLFR